MSSSTTTATTYKIRYNARTALYRKLFFMMWNVLNGPRMGRAHETHGRARALSHDHKIHELPWEVMCAMPKCIRRRHQELSFLACTLPCALAKWSLEHVCSSRWRKTNRLAHDLCVKFALSSVYFEFYCRIARAGYLFSALILLTDALFTFHIFIFGPSSPQPLLLSLPALWWMAYLYSVYG